MNRETTTPPASIRSEQQAEKAAERRPYTPPRIISHSSKELEKKALTVNACTSFIP